MSKGFCTSPCRSTHVHVRRLLPRHLSMVSIGGIGGLHRSQHVACARVHAAHSTRTRFSTHAPKHRIRSRHGGGLPHWEVLLDQSPHCPTSKEVVGCSRASDVEREMEEKGLRQSVLPPASNFGIFVFNMLIEFVFLNFLNSKHCS